MEVAVVILNWNGRDLLEKFLPSVVKNSKNATIYVIDNQSTDDSISFISTKYPQILFIKNIENYGYAKGYNEGLKLVNADILVLLNSDVEVAENWLTPIIKTFENEPLTAIIQPKILDYKNKNQFEYAGAAGGFIDKFGYPYCRGRIFETVEEDTKQYDESTEIFWASGACFCVRRSVFDELDGFDKTFFAHQEEIDFCWRAFNKGFIAKYEPKSIVYHVGGATLDASKPEKTFLNFRNSLLMLTKNLPKSQLLFVIFVRMVLDGIAGIKFLFGGKLKHFTAILRAHFAFYKMFSSALAKRETMQKLTYYRTKSIVFDYFILKNKIFNS
jgi:GT2 family glycosyltransferase